MKLARIAALYAAVLIAFASPALAQSPKRSELAPRAITVTAKPIESFSAAEPERARFGSLEFRGGLVLEADDKRFGGISGLRMASDDEDFLAITDRGHWLRGRLTLENGRPTGIKNAVIAPMLDGNGTTLASGSSYDTEALALGQNGDLYVGIERVHRIVRFDFGMRGFSSRARDVEVPRTFHGLPRNQGIEGLVFVPPGRPLGGSLIAFSERALDKAGNIRAFLVGGPSPGEFAVRRSSDFDITDAALTPDGDILLLERHFSWVRGVGMRIRLLPLSGIRPGALVDGTVLIQAGNAHQVDNMEGMSAHRTADGEVIVTVVSDDNFSGLQRTLLLRFALIED